MRIATALWTLAAMAAIGSRCPAAAPDVRQGRGLAAPDEKPVLVAAELPPTEIADAAAAAPQTERALGVKAPRAGGAEARPGERGAPTRLAPQVARVQRRGTARGIVAGAPKAPRAVGNLRPTVVKRSISAAPRTAPTKRLAATTAARIAAGASLASADPAGKGQ